MVFSKSLRLAAGYVVFAHADSKCIAIDKTVTGCADCPVDSDDQISGGQCIRGGNYYKCYDSIEGCCADPQISWQPQNSQCVSNYAPVDGSGKPVQKVGDCDKVVARTSVTTNSACQDKCRSLKESDEAPGTDYTDICMEEHYVFGVNGDGRVHFSGKCFDGWIHGYLEPENLAAFRTIYDVKTPALCQKECQEDDECVRFAWISPEGQAGQYSTAYSCLLKNRKQVEVPATILYPTEENPKSFDVDYCNIQTWWQCWNGYDCAPCGSDGSKSCIWGTTQHISGWKFCPRSNVCEVPEPDSLLSTTLAPVTPRVTSEVTESESSTTALESTTITETTETESTTSALITTESEEASRSDITETIPASSIPTVVPKPFVPITRTVTEAIKTSVSITAEAPRTTKTSVTVSTSTEKPVTTKISKNSTTQSTVEVSTRKTKNTTEASTKEPESTIEVTTQKITKTPESTTKEQPATTKATTESSTERPKSVKTETTESSTTVEATTATERSTKKTVETMSTGELTESTTESSLTEESTVSLTTESTTDCTECPADECDDCDDCEACAHESECNGCPSHQHHRHHCGACDECDGECNECGGCDGRRGCNNCESESTEAHGIDLRIHDKPKHIRIAVDN